MNCASFGGNAFGKALNGLDENGKAIPYALGHFFMAINPAFFMGLETFKRIAGTICRELRASRRMPGWERIYTAGEKEWEARRERLAQGCPVPPALQRVLVEIRDRYRLPYRFAFDPPA